LDVILARVAAAMGAFKPRDPCAHVVISEEAYAQRGTEALLRYPRLVVRALGPLSLRVSSAAERKLHVAEATIH